MCLYRGGNISVYLRENTNRTCLGACVYERAPGPPAAADAALLSEEVVGVAPAAAVREEEAARGALVKVKPGHVARADALVLHLRALVCKQKIYSKTPKRNMVYEHCVDML